MTDRDTLAWCSRCNEPLVWTFIVPRCEWYCVTCGGAWGMFDASSVNATEKRQARAEAAKELLVETAKDLIVSHSLHEDCPLCFGPEKLGSYHRDHATAEQLAASDAALEALRALQTKRPKVSA